MNVDFFGTPILLIWEIFEIFGFVLEIVIVLEVVLGTRMTRIYWICADFNFRFGSAKAEADNDGFSLRLKTVTEHLSCFRFLNVEFFGTRILLIGEIFEILIGVNLYNFGRGLQRLRFSKP